MTHSCYWLRHRYIKVISNPSSATFWKTATNYDRTSWILGSKQSFVTPPPLPALLDKLTLRLPYHQYSLCSVEYYLLSFLPISNNILLQALYLDYFWTVQCLGGQIQFSDIVRGPIYLRKPTLRYCSVWLVGLCWCKIPFLFHVKLTYLRHFWYFVIVICRGRSLTKTDNKFYLKRKLKHISFVCFKFSKKQKPSFLFRALSLLF